MPIWFAEQAHRLWKAEAERLETAWGQAEAVKAILEAQVQSHRLVLDSHRQAYLNAGGAGIEDLLERIAEWRNIHSKRAANARQYQLLAKNLGLPDGIDAATLTGNQQEAQTRAARLDEEIHAAQQEAFNRGMDERNAREQLDKQQKEYAEVRKRPGSNLPSIFQDFRKALALFLHLDETALPFVAEMLQVKEAEQAWRGAIERAIGSHRLRILVPPEAAERALFR